MRRSRRARRGRRGHEHDHRAAGDYVGEGVLDPGQLRFEPGRDAVLPPGVVNKILLTPVPFRERGIAHHDVRGPEPVSVVAEGVFRLHVERERGRWLIGEGEPECGDAGQ